MKTLPSNVTVLAGHHSTCNPEVGRYGCVMDIVSYVCEYDTITDTPPCACPVLTKFAIRLNDSIKDTELRTELLLPLVVKLSGSKSTPEVELKRAYYFADRAVRLFAPITLEVRGYKERATILRALPEIVDRQTALQAKNDAAAYAADAAAAYAAAAYAADAAAYAADAAAAYAADAAGAAAYAADAAAYAAAAADAAAYAAGAAAYAAGAAAAGIYKQAAQVLDTATQIN